MTEIDINNLPVFPLYDYHYASWFEKITPNGSTLDAEQRQELIRMIDADVAMNADFIRFIKNSLMELEGKDSDYYNIERVITNAWLFTAQTSADCMVACKYFLLANTDYDRRFMRGKLQVILNEGIKKLVGFKHDDKGKVWTSIVGIMNHFTGSEYRRQFAELDDLLRQHVSSSSWWRDERNAETHLDALGILKSRQRELDESTVMIESMQLIGAIDAVNHFIQNLHAGLTNWLNDLYRRHPEQFH